MLTKLGFSVLVACDGREGIELFRQQGDDVVAVLLDMVMPGLSSEETFREMRRIRPDLSVLLSSGISEQEVAEVFHTEGFSGFIRKPYELDELVRALRRAVERRAAV